MQEDNHNIKDTTIATAIGALFGTLILIGFKIVFKPVTMVEGKTIISHNYNVYDDVINAIPLISVIISGLALYIMSKIKEGGQKRKIDADFEATKERLKPMLEDPITSEEHKQRLREAYELKQKEYLESL